MKSFIIIATQGGGCDYTIGCGVKYWFESANSMEEMKAEVEKKLLSDTDEYDYDDCDLNPGRLRTDMWAEQSYDSLDIYEIGEGHYAVPLTKLANQLKKKAEDAKNKRKDDAERKEYEKLQKKFDPNFKPKPKPVLDKVCVTCDQSFTTKQKNKDTCKSCRKKEKEDLKAKQLEAVERSATMRSVLNTLDAAGWRVGRMYGERVSGKIKVDDMALIYFYDALRMKGNKKTYTWRRGTFEEAKPFLPKSAIKIFEDNPWLKR